MAAASVILGGIMFARRRRRMAEEDVDSSSLEEYVPETEHLGEDLLDGNELEMETDQTTLLQNLEDENGKLKAEKTKLESECVQKEIHMKKLENLLESLRKEKQSENKWKREFEELKEEKEQLEANLVQDYEKLQFVCKIKDLEIMEQKIIAEKFEKKKLKAEKEEVRKTENKDEHKRKSLLMAGLSAQMNNRIKEAVDIFPQALAVETDNDEGTALLHVFRAEANAATEKPPNMDIVLDCSMAIEGGTTSNSAFSTRP
ncbi:uncharacterized protein [Palaemon carinicauda]|uniref:uncharacterized protein n=1 Tax=Palaemon carinicauda TaxID=392227 RepID=UPI0035B5A301